MPSDTKKILIEPKESVKIPGEKLSTKNTERPEPVKSVYEIVTVPDIQKTWSRLTGLAEDFRGALASVKKVEHIIYPLLVSKTPYLADPDPAVIQDLKKLNQ